MKKINRRGFTLVELLAVIVILAILMVSAGAGVMSTMNNSKINTFKNEVLTAINSAEDMYSEISMSTTDYGKFVQSNSDGDNTGTHSGMCVTFSGLVNNGYLNKDVTTYGGIILVEVPYDGGATKYMVWAHNSTYGIGGVEKNNINKLKFNKKNNDSATSSITTTGYEDAANTGAVGILTQLAGIKSLLSVAYGSTSAMGEVTKGSDCDVTTPTSSAVSCNNQVVTLKSEKTRGGTGNTYELKCINVKLES